MSNVTRLSWEIELREYGFSLPLRHDQAVTDVGQAVRSCIGSIATAYELDVATQNVMWQRVDSTRFVLTAGNEKIPGSTYINASTKIPIGIVEKQRNSNVIDILTRQSLVSQSETEQTPRVDIATKALAEEALMLRKTAEGYLGGISTAPQSAREKIEQIAQDDYYLASLAVRVAASRRLLRYVLFPDDCLTQNQQRTVGFEKWLETTIKPHHPNISQNLANKARDAYVGHDTAIKSLRKTLWAPLLHQIVDIEASEIFYYLLYTKYATGIANNTFVFDDIGTIILDKEEARTTITDIFAQKKRLKRIK